MKIQKITNKFILSYSMQITDSSTFIQYVYGLQSSSDDPHFHSTTTEIFP